MHVTIPLNPLSRGDQTAKLSGHMLHWAHISVVCQALILPVIAVYHLDVLTLKDLSLFEGKITCILNERSM